MLHFPPLLLGSSLIDYFADGQSLTPGNDTPVARPQTQTPLRPDPIRAFEDTKVENYF